MESAAGRHASENRRWGVGYIALGLGAMATSWLLASATAALGPIVLVWYGLFFVGAVSLASGLMTVLTGEDMGDDMK